MSLSDSAAVSKISVVVPCYNAHRWIAETLLSVVAQRDVDLEVVLIDDGSTDGSYDSIAAGATDVPVQIIHQPHAGASQARNVGTRFATGQFLQYLDADDLLEPGTLSARAHALQTSGADIAYCDWQRWEFKSDGSFGRGEVSSRVLSSRPEIDLLSDAWWPPGALLYRRDVIQRVSAWNRNLSVNQDVQFLLLLAADGARFVKVDGVGLRYRVGDGSSLSTKDHQLFLTDCYKNACELQDLWQSQGRLDSYRRQALRRTYRYLARIFAIEPLMRDETLSRIARLDIRLESRPRPTHKERRP